MMKKGRQKKDSKKLSSRKEPIRTLLKREGKLVHGTRGKPTHGPRGNKR